MDSNRSRSSGVEDMGKKRLNLRATALMDDDAAAELHQKKKTKKLEKQVKLHEEGDSSDENEDAEISLDNELIQDLEEFTFEFYDLKDSHVEGISSLLKPVFSNISYEIALASVSQSTPSIFSYDPL